MARDILHVGDVGIPIVVQVINRKTRQPVNLADFVSAKIRIKAPSAAAVSKTATLVGDGATGEIQFVTEPGDLAEAGTYTVQAYEVVTAGDGPWHGDTDTFLVRGNL